VFAAAFAAACETTGVGASFTGVESNLVNFNWRSEGSVSGTMTATVAATSEVFRGQFYQITSSTRVDDLGSLWIGWRRPTDGWPYWEPDDGSAFVMHYSGRVLANLEGTNTQHMRCSFQLMHPSSGMPSGGIGHCQMPNGKAIDATFPKS
jgi:hypothetical protein